MKLIPKSQMIHKDWKDFACYPKQGSNIVLHVKGYQIRQNKNIHDFVSITNFNAASFDVRDFTPKIEGVTWNYSWLPIETLKADE